MCHCLYQVVSQRFQQSTAEAVWTVVGTVIFLRFINPAIGTINSNQSRQLFNQPAIVLSACCAAWRKKVILSRKEVSK